MIRNTLGTVSLQIKSRMHREQKQLWDPIRKQWVVATPEEHVRQHWIVYLLEQLKVPSSLVEVEWSLTHLDKGNPKRVDVVVWKAGQGATPWLLLECKAPEISLEKSDSLISFQVAQYLNKLPAEFLVVSNGPKTLYWKRKRKDYQPIESLPYYSGTLS